MQAHRGSVGRAAVPRPELAVRVTVALHRLVRLVTAEPVAFRSVCDGHDADGDPELDVRDLAPAQRHESIFAGYHALALGAGFVLVNDHDPKPLRYQFEAEHPGEFTWDYLEAGPKVWRVRIGRTAGVGGSEMTSPSTGSRLWRLGDLNGVPLQRFECGERRVVVVTLGKELVALDDTCSHRKRVAHRRG